MPAPQSITDPIQVTEALVRLYVFLAQYLDRCLDRAKRESFPEEALQAHLAQTRQELADTLAVNPVVKNKVHHECERVLALGASCLRGGSSKEAVLGEIQAERAVLQHKTVALSDLLAVFRAG